MPRLSPLIYQWAERNRVFLFDFDNWIFQPDITPEFLEEYVNSIIPHYDYFLVCEQHPFAHHDTRHVLRHGQILEIVAPKIKTLFSTSDWNNWSPTNTSNYTFLPTWYFEQRAWSIDLEYDKFKFKTDRPYTFSCVNKANFRPEKIANYMKCYTRRSPDWFITAYAWEGMHIPDSVPGLTPTEIYLWDNEVCPNLKPFSDDLENSSSLNNPNALPESTPNAFSLLFPGYTQAHINLAIEHSMEFTIASEKTYKPFAAEQIPIFVGYTGIAKFASELGFDIFSDIIDHTQYDTIEQVQTEASWVPRVNAVHTMIDTLIATDFKTTIVSEDVWKRRKANKEYFYSDGIDKKCIFWLDHLLEHNKR